MVRLTTTANILHAIAALPADFSLHESHSSLPLTIGSPISHQTLLRISKCLPTYSLNWLLQGTKIYIVPSPSKPEPSEEYKKLMARLRADQEQKDYKAMVAKEEAESQQALSGYLEGMDSDDADDISPSLVLNILLSIVLCAAVAFHLTKWWPNDGVRVLFSLGTAFVVGTAEVTVYAAYLRKVDESRRKERRVKERKQVIGEYTGNADGVDAWGTAVEEIVSVDTTEIWGRGANGGMRQRVRDKWANQNHSDTKS